MNPIDLAAKELGLSETGQRAALQDYLTTGGASLDPATTAWCAAFVNATLAKAGMRGTGSNMARDFMQWGQAVDQPQRGDIAVFRRGDPNGPYGHVGFFDGYNADGTIRVLGGNQGNAVSLASYSPTDLLGFRRGQAPQSATAALAPQPNPLMPVMPQSAAFHLDPAAFMAKRSWT